MFFRVLGEPKGKGRPRSDGSHMYTPKQTREYEKKVREAYKIACGSFCFPKGVPIAVNIKAFMKIPKSASKKQRKAMLAGEILPTKKPDRDNIDKIIMDALNGVAFYDDAQVVAGGVLKLYGLVPRVEVQIRAIKRITNEGADYENGR